MPSDQTFFSDDTTIYYGITRTVKSIEFNSDLKEVKFYRPSSTVPKVPLFQAGLDALPGTESWRNIVAGLEGQSFSKTYRLKFLTESNSPAELTLKKDSSGAISGTIDGYIEPASVVTYDERNRSFRIDFPEAQTLKFRCELPRRGNGKFLRELNNNQLRETAIARVGCKNPKFVPTPCIRDRRTLGCDIE